MTLPEEFEETHEYSIRSESSLPVGINQGEKVNLRDGIPLIFHSNCFKYPLQDSPFKIWINAKKFQFSDPTTTRLSSPVSSHPKELKL